MTSRLYFGRRAKVFVQRIGNPTPVSMIAGTGDVSGVPFVSDGIALASVFDKLHVQFKVEKDNLGHPNTMDLTIFNLADRTRGQLQDSGGYVQLFAGYSSDWPNLPIVFQGNARTIDHGRQGADWITKIQCGDGETSYRYGVATQSFAAGATAVQIATFLANQVKAADPAHIDVSRFLQKLNSVKFPIPTFVWGFAVQGNAFEELQRLIGGTYELSIQDGELRVLALAEGTQTVVLIDAAHGMIESPVHGTPNANGLPSTLNVKMLLTPTIKPGDLVKISAKNTEGTYRAQKLIHSGDVASNDWYTSLECMPIQSSASAAA
jgi:hypothetical protein